MVLDTNIPISALISSAGNPQSSIPLGKTVEPNQNQKTRRGCRPATTCERISRSQRRFSWRCPRRIEAEVGETMPTFGPSKLTDATALYCEASLLYFLAELNEFSNLGKGPGTMKVPYAKKWQKETDKLRQIALDCDLTEELKWGKPCFTFLKKNVAIVIPLKESCAFSFFKGALLKDPKHVLERIGEHTQAGRWIKFTSLREIAALRSTLKDYLYEAIELEESGKKIELKKPSEYPIPEELQRRLDDNAVLRSAFATLTPGRRKSYIFHVSSAKQAKTRAARAEKCVPMILSGRGFNELPN